MFQFLEDESHRAATLAWKNVVVIVDNSLIGMELEQRIGTYRVRTENI